MTLPSDLQDVVLIEPRWERKVTVSRMWSTSIQRTTKGEEKRSAILYQPMHALKYDVLAENVVEVMALKSRMQQFGHSRLGIPIWPWRTELSSSVAAGASNLPVTSTAYLNLQEGDLVIVYQDLSTYEVLGVASVEAEAVQLDGGTESAWPRGTSVYKLLPALLQSPKVSMLTDRAATAGIEAEEHPYIWPSMDFSWVPYTTTTTTTTTTTATGTTVSGTTTTTVTVAPSGPVTLSGIYAARGEDPYPYNAVELNSGGDALVDGVRDDGGLNLNSTPMFYPARWMGTESIGADVGEGAAVQVLRIDIYGKALYTQDYTYGPPPLTGFEGGIQVFRSDNNFNWVAVASFSALALHYLDNQFWPTVAGMRLKLPSGVPASRFWKATVTTADLKIAADAVDTIYFAPTEIELFDPLNVQITDGYTG